MSASNSLIYDGLLQRWYRQSRNRMRTPDLPSQAAAHLSTGENIVCTDYNE
jgi:hypothetical protein